MFNLLLRTTWEQIIKPLLRKDVGFLIIKFNILAEVPHFAPCSKMGFPVSPGFSINVQGNQGWE